MSEVPLYITHKEPPTPTLRPYSRRIQMPCGGPGGGGGVTSVVPLYWLWASFKPATASPLSRVPIPSEEGTTVRFEGLSLKGHGQNLVLTALCVPYSISADKGPHAGDGPQKPGSRVSASFPSRVASVSVCLSC